MGARGRTWIKQHEDHLRLWMILLLIIYVAVLSWFVIPTMLNKDEDICNAVRENNVTLEQVVRKAYTPLRPELLSPEQLDYLAEQREAVLATIDDPPSCDF